MREPDRERDAFSPVPSDEALADHLARRGGHPAPRTLAPSIVARIAETAPERRWRLTLRAWEPRMAVLALGSALVLVASFLYFGGTPPRSGGLPTPSPLSGPTAAPAAITWDPSQRALTPPELLRILAAHPAPGTLLIVDDQIIQLCIRLGDCPTGELANAPGVIVEPPAGGHLPASTDGGPTTPVVVGPLALRVGSGPNLVFLGAVISNGLGLSFSAHDLVARSAMGGLFVIPAWFWKTGPVPCPSVASTPASTPPQPTSELGLPAPELNSCAGSSYLTDLEPTFPIYNSPSDGFVVQADAYPSGSAPRQGIYLVRDWAGYGEILGRLEPLPIPDREATETQSPSSSSEPSDSTPGGIVMSVGELVRRVQQGSLPPGSIAIADVPASAVTGYWDPGVVHSCPQYCPTWRLVAGVQWVTVDVFEGAPPVTSIVGTQAFIVEEGGAIRALGHVSIGGGVGRPNEAPDDGGLWVVQGWLRLGITEPLPCPAPQRSTITGLLGEPLGWSGCPGAWIAVTPFGASGPGGTVLTDSAPNGGLHVQDGAGDASFQPSLGAWLVRSVVSGCPNGPSCPATLTDRPPTNATWWELVGLIAGPTSSPTTPPLPTPEPPTQPTSSVVTDIGPVWSYIFSDDPTWDRLADLRGVATACFGASDCASLDPWSRA